MRWWRHAITDQVDAQARFRPARSIASSRRSRRRNAARGSDRVRDRARAADRARARAALAARARTRGVRPARACGTPSTTTACWSTCLLADRDVEIVADRGIHRARRRRRVAGDLPADGDGVPRGPLRGRRARRHRGDLRVARAVVPEGARRQRAARPARRHLNLPVSGTCPTRRRQWPCRLLDADQVQRVDARLVAPVQEHDQRHRRATNTPNIRIAVLTDRPERTISA